MPFYSHSDTADRFYDVTISKKPDGTFQTVKFAAADEEKIGAQYRIYDAFARDVNSDMSDPDDQAKVSFNSGYYGVDKVEEAAGTVRFHTTTVLDSENKINE